MEDNVTDQDASQFTLMAETSMILKTPQAKSLLSKIARMELNVPKLTVNSIMIAEMELNVPKLTVNSIINANMESTAENKPLLVN